MSKVLILSFSEVSNDARVLRQAAFLAAEFQVVLAAFGRPPALLGAGIQIIELPSAHPGFVRGNVESVARIALRLAGAYRRAYWRDARARGWQAELNHALPVDAVVVNDLFGLPFAREVARGAPVIFDAHEHWTSESASWSRVQRISMRRSHDWIVDEYVPRTAGMMTVSAGIARSFKERTGVSPAIVTSAPFFQKLRPSEVTEPIRLLHVGVADERRHLEDTIEAVRSLDGQFTLDLVLVRDNAYRSRLERLVAAEPHIRVLPPVAVDELVSFANSYDIGVFLLPAMYPNQIDVLPNKLFDYIQARLAVAIGPSREMAEIVRAWDCGVVSASFAPASFAEALATLTVEDVRLMKANADRAARALNADSNRETVVALVKQAIADQQAEGR